MAKILRWQEKLVLACLTLFLPVARAWPLGTYNAANHDRPVYSRLVTGMNQKTVFGLELMAQRPYARLIRASLVPVSLPLAAGAYMAMAGSPGAAAGAAAAAASSSCGGTCDPRNAPCCSVTNAACCNADCYYWNYECNIEVGLTILNDAQTTAEGNWASNYQASGYSSPNDPNNPYPYCDFLANTQPAGSSSSGDADWIQAYNGHSNGHYYLWWVTGTGWVFKYQTSETGGGYVPAVCQSTPF